MVTRDWPLGGREDRLEEVERSDGRSRDVSPGGSSSLKYEEEPFILLYVKELLLLGLLLQLSSLLL